MKWPNSSSDWQSQMRIPRRMNPATATRGKACMGICVILTDPFVSTRWDNHLSLTGKGSTEVFRKSGKPVMANGLWPRDSSPVQRSSAPGYPPHHISVRCRAFATKRRWFVRMVSGVLHVSPSARQYGNQLAGSGMEPAADTSSHSFRFSKRRSVADS